MGKQLKVTDMLENEVAEPGDAGTAIRSIEIENTGRFWVVERIEGDEFWFRKVIAWAVVVEQLVGFSPVSVVRPLVIDAEMGVLEVSHGNAIELDNLPEGAEISKHSEVTLRKLPDTVIAAMSINSFFIPVANR